ncbi:CRISPR-associated endonuclease Cas1 [Streptomyces sp. ME19-01-6]|uniref:CRISPR-associated endonuclease Cas1 n=1 Tax=Streptomyces sp. ME19-01-6 TaxID=3028686 RepID=UPI0029B1DFCF|nr:CRISPR-associated endonuclease Cas1 [Streptomyces sp. ME19-01-6]MDX3224601.1 CRISPR-associated endonuclease Cas1 [Streptomyces sp. ME19-01-6]
MEHDTLRVHLPDTPGRRTLPLRRIESIVVYGHINLSTELITRCAQDTLNGLPMSASASGGGRPPG